jgi:hypothetical protein
MTRALRAMTILLAGLIPALLPPSLAQAQARFVPLYRWWSPIVGDHFYTTDATFEPSPESGYTPEGITGYVATTQIPATTALHRWWNGEIGDHFYTTDPTGEAAPTSGYVSEGITGYVATTEVLGTAPLYRWWNPEIGDHLYTTDPADPGSGYGYERIECYVWTAIPPYTQTFNVTRDWSYLQNPNGVWSYNQGSTPLPQTFFPWINVAERFWANGEWPPAWTRAKTDPTGDWGTDGDGDWAVGDVIVHSATKGDPGGLANLTWTSPGDGAIDVSGKVWDAYHYGWRDDSWRMELNGSVLAGRGSVQNVHRSAPEASMSANTAPGQTLARLSVRAGDVLTLFVESQPLDRETDPAGHFVGVDLVVEFTPGFVYRYEGHTFDLFSCADNTLCGTPDPAYTSYGAGDFVTATLGFTDRLPGNLNLEDVSGYPGFTLRIKDGHQKLFAPSEVLVSTDAAGNVVAPWSVASNGAAGNRVSTVNRPGNEVRDEGVLRAPTEADPSIPFDRGRNDGQPGSWNGPPPPDRDGDGVPDAQDACPDLPGDPAYGGCPPPPTVQCPPSVTFKSCELGAIQPLPYSTATVPISLAQLTAEGGNATAACGIGSITYQDRSTGSCPNRVAYRTFTVTDGCNRSASCQQTIRLARAPEPLVDLAVLDTWWSAMATDPPWWPPPYTEWAVCLRAKIANLGTAAAANVMIRFPNRVVQVPSLPAGTSKWVYSTAGTDNGCPRYASGFRYELEVRVDPFDRIPETNESNNAKKTVVDLSR